MGKTTKTKAKTHKKPVAQIDFTAHVQWVVLGGRAATRIFKVAAKTLQSIEVLKNPEARKLDTELASDRPGRSFASAGGGVRHALESQTKAHEFQAKKSAKSVAAFLKAAHNDGRFTDLVLMAEPHFLGLLRGALGKKLGGLVSHEVAKEILGKTDAEVKLRAFQELTELEGKPTPTRLEETPTASAAREGEPAVDYPLEVTFRDIPPTEALRNLILQRAAKMSRFSKHIINGHVMISTPHRKKNHGTVYHVSIHLHLPNKEIVINRDPEKDPTHEDAHVSIRDAFLAATRQLEDFVRVRKGL